MGDHIHIIAVCGSGTGALAGLLKSKGHQITGSDKNIYPPVSDLLKKLNIPVYKGFSKKNIYPIPNRVVIGNAVRRDNPEVLAVMEKKIPYMSMPEALAHYFLEGKQTIVVSGTHGKTTTSALAAWLLHFAGEDPGFLVGGILKNFGSSYRLGGGRYFVVEGDEYDSAFFDKGPKFLHYKPHYTILTSVEFDHADIYTDLEHIKNNFARLVNLIPENGRLIHSADYESIGDILSKNKPACPTISFGRKSSSQWRTKNVRYTPEEMCFQVFQKVGNLEKAWGEFSSPVFGEHNLTNILSVLAVMNEIGIPPEVLQEGLKKFKGVKRRQEILDEVDGITIIDDFAHHPTAVKETIASISARFPRRKIWAVFEPRTNTNRRKFFQDLYPHAFAQADHTLIAPVFNSTVIETENILDTEKLAQDIRGNGGEARAACGVSEIVDILSREIKTDDVILIMSNGGFGDIYHSLPHAMRERTINARNIF